MSYSEIRARLNQAGRVWGQRSNNAAQLDQRQEAERMLQLLASAEAALLKPAVRRGYDERWRGRQSPQIGGATRSPQTMSPRVPMGRPVDVAPTSNASASIPAHVLPWNSPAVLESQQPATGDESTLIQRNWTGWTTLRGTVIHSDPVYGIPPTTNWFRVCFRVCAVICLIPVVALVALMSACMRVAVRMMFPRIRDRGDRGGSNLLLLLMTFMTSRAGIGSRAQVPVRDIRVRDVDGTEHLVRMIGQVVSGNVNVGDDVTLSGFARGGTLRARQGINHRTRSVIRVRT